MEINKEFKLRKKFVSSLMNIVLVLGVFIVLFPLSTPTVKADTLWYDNWDILPGQDITLDDDTIILNGSLTIEGKLTLDNCTLYMRHKPPNDPDGHSILVEETGEFNVLSNSIITTYPSSPDPYEFEVQKVGMQEGSLTIQSSTVENMA